MACVLVVDDEQAVRQALAAALGAHGHEVLEASGPQEGLTKARLAQPDLILLDVMMPGRDGFSVLAELRASGHQGPVIMLTAKGAELDKVRGFALGADDYVVKPFGLLELLGRVGAVLRRSQGPSAPALASSGLLRWGDWEVDLKTERASRAGQGLDLPERAIPLLAALVQAGGQVLDREALRQAAWGPGSEGNPRSVDNLVVKLRAALEPNPERPTLLVTATGRGYRWLGPQPEA